MKNYNYRPGYALSLIRIKNSEELYRISTQACQVQRNKRNNFFSTYRTNRNNVPYISYCKSNPLSNFSYIQLNELHKKHQTKNCEPTFYS